MNNHYSPLEAPIDNLAPDEGIDLQHYWRIIKKHRRPIVGIVLVAALFSILIAYTLTPVYRSLATLLVEVNPGKVVSIEEVYGANLASREYLESQYEILKSRTLLQQVIDRLDLASHPEFRPGAARPWYARWFDAGPGSADAAGAAPASLTPEDQERLFDAVLSRLVVQPVRRTQLIKIGFEAHDRRLAATVANAVARAYIESSIEARVQTTQKATEWLSERLEELQKKQIESEKALREYVARQPLSAFESLPEILGDPTIQRLKQTEADTLRKISELSRQYGPAHPKMIAANTELESVRGNLRRELRVITNSLAAAPDDSKATAPMQVPAGSINPLQRTTQLHTLQREVIANRQLYNLFLERIKETKLLGDINTTNIRVIDPALPALAPFKPRKTFIVTLSVLAALLASMLLAFLLEYLNNTLKNAADVEARLGLPTLGIVPNLWAKGMESSEISSAAHAFVEDYRSPFAESIRTIRTGVMLSALDEPHKIVLITSSVQGEGKTVVSINLARALARLEPKVLLLDADMRKPSLAQSCGLPPDTPGLSNLVAGTASERQCIHNLADGLDILPSGVVPPNPLELLSSRRFAELLERLSERYSRIVIDSAPLHEVSDAQIISTRASAVALVAKADATPHQVVQAALKRLHASHAHVIGVILNMVDVVRLAEWDSFGGYSNYGYGYYGHGQPAGSRRATG